MDAEVCHVSALAFTHSVYCVVWTDVAFPDDLDQLEYGVDRLCLTGILSSALNGDEWSSPRPGPLHPGGKMLTMVSCLCL
jgi:hypothetical protein